VALAYPFIASEVTRRAGHEHYMTAVVTGARAKGTKQSLIAQADKVKAIDCRWILYHRRWCNGEVRASPA